MMNIYGIDIGGANIKLCNISLIEKRIDGIKCNTLQFYTIGQLLWTIVNNISKPEYIVLSQTIAGSRKHYQSYKEGIKSIIALFNNIYSERKTYFVVDDYKLLCTQDIDSNCIEPKELTSTNWVGAAYLFVKYFRCISTGMIIDCGTTSTDIIPIIDGKIKTLSSRKDPIYYRFATGEFLWSGLLYTPISSICNKILFDGKMLPIKPNSSVTTSDIYLVLDMISKKDFSIPIKENDFVYTHGDHEPSYENSIYKLSNLIGLDLEILTEKDVLSIAQYIYEKHVAQIRLSICKVKKKIEDKFRMKLDTVVLAGMGNKTIIKEATRNLFSNVIISENETERFFKNTPRNIGKNCETALGSALLGYNLLVR